MMYKILYLNEVENDIIKAKQWYSEQQQDLEKRFVLAVKDAISNIIKMPAAYAIRYKNIRIAHTKNFPFNIHFYIDDTNLQVVIIGIIHNKRNDAIILDRITTT